MIVFLSVRLRTWFPCDYIIDKIFIAQLCYQIFSICHHFTSMIVNYPPSKASGIAVALFFKIVTSLALLAPNSSANCSLWCYHFIKKASLNQYQSFRRSYYLPYMGTSVADIAFVLVADTAAAV